MDKAPTGSKLCSSALTPANDDYKLLQPVGIKYVMDN